MKKNRFLQTFLFLVALMSFILTVKTNRALANETKLNFNRLDFVSEVEHIDIKKLEQLKKRASFKFVNKLNYKVPELFVFVDPLCPYCKVMIKVAQDLANQEKLNAYIYLTPVLSPQSKQIATSILCDKKTDNERLQGYLSLYTSNNQCKQGKNEIELNINIFHELQSNAIPISLLKTKNKTKHKIYLIKGTIKKETLNKLLDEEI